MFEMLNETRRRTTLLEAKNVCAKYLDRFTGGKPLSEDALPFERYQEFITAVTNREEG